MTNFLNFVKATGATAQLCNGKFLLYVPFKTGSEGSEATVYAEILKAGLVVLDVYHASNGMFYRAKVPVGAMLDNCVTENEKTSMLLEILRVLLGDIG